MEVLAAVATGILALLTTVVAELIRRTARQGKVLGDVATQVVNQHSTNLRDDITNISTKVDRIHRDLLVEREDRRDLARAHYALADVVNRLSRECPLAAGRPPAPVPDPPEPPTEASAPPATDTPPPPPAHAVG